MYTAVHSLVKERPNSIFLNAGDNFQGTFWYNVHKWNVTQHFLNKLPTDAYVRHLTKDILLLNKKASSSFVLDTG